MIKKWISLLLSAALVLALALPAAASSATFPDISDAQTQREVSVLQMMGVVAGTASGTFSPNGTLTRAQFCKMAVTVMGRGNEEPLYRSRTIFPDVRSTHWARGYINLAVSIDIGAGEDGTGGTKLIRGMSDGTFQPDRSITYAESVTILLRMLGYADADAGMLWPKGYLDLAAKIGLTGGLSLAANAALTRAQAAHLFTSLLTTAQKGGSAYYNTLGTATQDVVLTNGNATADDGTVGAMGTSSGIYKTASGIVPASLVGCRGVLVIDDAGKAAAFIPTGSQKTITVGSAQAGWIKDAGGVKYTLPTSAPAYTADDTTTYDKVWMDLTAGMQVTLFYASTGKVDGVYVNTQSSDTAAVASVAGGSAFSGLLNGATGYTVYRDGSTASLSDVCLYDVGTYDAATRVLSVSSTKLTGVYENVWPNEESPAKVTIMGLELNVLSDAMEDMASFQIGDSVTVLLTADHQVAGVVSSDKLREVNVGVVEEADGTNLSVRLLSGLTITGKNTKTGLVGELVSAGSSGVGKLFASRLSGSNVEGDFSVADRTVGKTALSGNARLYERAGRSKLSEISFDDLAVALVASSKIDYALVNTSGKIDALVLNDVTGDRYTYGFLKRYTKSTTDEEGESTKRNTYLTLLNHDNPDGEEKFERDINAKSGQAIGLAFTSSGTDISCFVTLTAQTGVKRSAFHTADDVTTVTLGTQTMRVSDDVQCYNGTTERWFGGLEDARAFSDNLTVYYDKPAAQGGKVRLVVTQ